MLIVMTVFLACGKSESPVAEQSVQPENDETFRSLLKQVRSDLAERYIRNDDYSITEIAFLLGYTDTSAFSRAYRNLFGRPPTQTRAEGKAA